MLRILLIKTSSMGDVVHNLPVVSDIRVHVPGASIDWAVEESFSALPRLHPGVNAVIPVALRRWRGSLFSRRTWQEIGALRRSLGSEPHDIVIDTQGLLKSALLARLASGRRHGLDWRSSREPLHAFYDRVHAVAWDRHAVERNRALAGLALGYRPEGPPVYGISAGSDQRSALAAEFALGTPTLQQHAVFLHGTSAASKEWPEAHWVALGAALSRSGLACVLPAGSAAERDRSHRLAAAIPGAVVPPRLGLDALSALLAGARIVAGVDTGLSHLAVALGAKTVGIYCSTDPAATGLYGAPGLRNVGGIGRCPAVREVLDAVDALGTPA